MIFRYVFTLYENKHNKTIYIFSMNICVLNVYPFRQIQKQYTVEVCLSFSDKFKYSQINSFYFIIKIVLISTYYVNYVMGTFIGVWQIQKQYNLIYWMFIGVWQIQVTMFIFVFSMYLFINNKILILGNTFIGLWQIQKQYKLIYWMFIGVWQIQETQKSFIICMRFVVSTLFSLSNFHSTVLR